MDSFFQSTRTSFFPTPASSTVDDSIGTIRLSPAVTVEVKDGNLVTMSGLTSRPSLIQTLIHGSEHSEVSGERSFIRQTLNSDQIRSQRHVLHQALLLPTSDRSGDRHNVTSPVRISSDSIVSRLASRVQSSVNQCSDCGNFSSPSLPDSDGREVSLSVIQSEASIVNSSGESSPLTSTSPSLNSSSSQAAPVPMHFLTSRQFLTQKSITQSAIMTPVTPVSASDVDLSDAGRLYSDPDYNFFSLNEDLEDYPISSSTSASSSSSGGTSITAAVSSFWNESVSALDSQFDNDRPSLNFSSLNGFFVTPSSLPQNISYVDDLPDSISPSDLGQNPDFTIHHPVLAIILGIMCLTVIAGNVLVMLAIRRERNLQTVTNYFVSSLAAADCLVGLIVMPFSVVHEVMNKSWIFGRDWCDLWHSFDVLASTASILNLCVISMDRYWAITDPLSYPAKLTSKRAKLLIAVVWLCSSLISFPAIAWWRAVSTTDPAEYQCMFTEDIGYLVFSSIISFYGPLSVMIFVYYRIYRAAVEQTACIDRGSKNVCMHTLHPATASSSAPSSRLNDPDNGPVVLRIHRGGFTSMSQAAAVAQQSQRFQKPNKKERPKRSKSTRAESTLSTIDDADDTDGAAGTTGLMSSDSSSAPAGGHSVDITVRAQRNLKAWSMGKRFAKLAKEKKAAKTLGIVMGVFILCWLPFFVTNILIGVCPESCISDPELVFSIVTWLGWLNSGMNPVIYACWSRDFRRAFKKILCSLFVCCRPLASGRNSFQGSTTAYYGTPAAAAAAAANSLASAHACRTGSSPNRPANQSHRHLHRNEKQQQNSTIGLCRPQPEAGNTCGKIKSVAEQAASRLISQSVGSGPVSPKREAQASCSSVCSPQQETPCYKQTSASAIDSDFPIGHSNPINVLTGFRSPAAAVVAEYGIACSGDGAPDQEQDVRFGSGRQAKGSRELPAGERSLIDSLSGDLKNETSEGLGDSGNEDENSVPVQRRGDGHDEEGRRHRGAEGVELRQSHSSSLPVREVNLLPANDLYCDPGDPVLFLQPHQLASRSSGCGCASDTDGYELSERQVKAGATATDALDHSLLFLQQDSSLSQHEGLHSASMSIAAASSYSLTMADVSNPHLTQSLDDRPFCRSDLVNDAAECGIIPNGDMANMGSHDQRKTENNSLTDRNESRGTVITKTEEVNEGRTSCRSGDIVNAKSEGNLSSSSSSSEGVIETVTITLQNTIIIRTS